MPSTTAATVADDLVQSTIRTTGASRTRASRAVLLVPDRQRRHRGRGSLDHGRIRSGGMPNKGTEDALLLHQEESRL